MKRFIDRASKVLAVVGVLMLMWTASEMQQAKADNVPVNLQLCKAAGPLVIPGRGGGWFTCTGTVCDGFFQVCCKTPKWDGVNNLNLPTSYNCCYTLVCPASG